jgi:hypothetical protein
MPARPAPQNAPFSSVSPSYSILLPISIFCDNDEEGEGRWFEFSR